MAVPDLGTATHRESCTASRTQAPLGINPRRGPIEGLAQGGDLRPLPDMRVGRDRVAHDVPGFTRPHGHPAQVARPCPEHLPVPFHGVVRVGLSGAGDGSEGELGKSEKFVVHQRPPAGSVPAAVVAQTEATDTGDTRVAGFGHIAQGMGHVLALEVAACLADLVRVLYGPVLAVEAGRPALAV